MINILMIMVNRRSMCLCPLWIVSGFLLRGQVDLYEVFLHEAQNQVDLGKAPTYKHDQGETIEFVGSQSFLQVKVQEKLQTSYTFTAKRHHCHILLKMGDLLPTRITKDRFSQDACHKLLVSSIGSLQVFEKLDANAYDKCLVQPEFLCSGVFKIMCRVGCEWCALRFADESFQPRVT